MPAQARGTKRTGSEPRKSGDASLAEVVKAGDLRTSLEALRDELAASMAYASPTAKALMAAQLLRVFQSIDELPDTTKRSKADELAARRKDRRAAAEAVAAAGGQNGK